MIKYLSIGITLILLLIGCDSKKYSHTIAKLTNVIAVNGGDEVIDITNAPIAYLGSIKKGDTYKLNKHPVVIKPTMANGILYMMDKENVYAFSLKEKRIIWNNNINQKGLMASSGGGMKYHNGKLYVTNGSRYVIILDANNGYEVLRKEFSDVIKTVPIILNDGKLLVQTISNQLEIFDFTTAKVTIINESYPEIIHSYYYMEPINYDNQIIFSYSSGAIFSLNYKNRESKWLVNMSDLAGKINITPGYDTIDVVCPPVIVDNKMYVANSLGQLLKIDIKTGKLIWHVNISDIQSMSHIGNSLFVTTNANQVAAISLITGKNKWVACLEDNNKKNKNLIFLQPTITYDESGQKYLTVISNKGKSYNFLWQGNNFNTEPIINNITNNITFMGNSCCNDIYFIADNKIIFINK